MKEIKTKLAKSILEKLGKQQRNLIVISLFSLWTRVDLHDGRIRDYYFCAVCTGFQLQSGWGIIKRTLFSISRKRAKLKSKSGSDMILEQFHRRNKDNVDFSGQAYNNPK